MAGLVALLASGCSRPGPAAPEHREPGTGRKALYTDLAGRTVAVSAPADIRRIILPRSKDILILAALLGDALPEYLVAWGPDLARDDARLYDALVARFPGLARIPVTGSVYGDGLAPEQLVALRPDLVILDKFMLGRGYAYPAKIDAAGLPAVYLDGSDDPFTGPLRGIALLGDILGKRERAAQIIAFIGARLDTVVSRIGADPGRRPSVYLEQGYLGPEQYGDSYGASGPGGRRTSWGQILYRLKVENIADDIVAGQAPIHPEFLLRANPDIIVITGQNWSNPGSMRLGCDVSPEEAAGILRSFAARPGWGTLAAVRGGRVFAVFHNTASILAFSGIQSLAKACYPARFADIDPEADRREFFRLFLPVAPGGTWACAIDEPASPQPLSDTKNQHEHQKKQNP